MKSLISAYPLLASLGLILLAGSAQAQFVQTQINGTPLGDPTAGVDWNVLSNDGDKLFQAASPSGALMGFGQTIGTYQGYAGTWASSGDLLAVAYKSVERTANVFNVSNTTSLSTNASGHFYDLISFSGTGGAFSVTFDPQATLSTLGGLPSIGEHEPLGSNERNFSRIESEVQFTLSVRNANGTTAQIINMGSYQRATSDGLFEARSSSFDPSIIDFAPISLNLTEGQSVFIFGSVNANVNVFSTVDLGRGAADSLASFDLYLTDLSDGWSYSTLSGATFAVPEPAAAPMVAGLAIFGIAAWRRRRA